MMRQAILTLAPYAKDPRLAPAPDKSVRMAKPDGGGELPAFELLLAERPRKPRAEHSVEEPPKRPESVKPDESKPMPQDARVEAIAIAPPQFSTVRSEPEVAVTAPPPPAIEPKAPRAAPEAAAVLPELPVEEPPSLVDFKVLAVETHPLPALRFEVPPFHTDAPIDAPPPLWPAQLPEPEAAPPEPVKFLKIMLHPRDLGELTLSLKLAGEVLHVAIEAYSGRALEAIRRDETILDRAIKEAGYADATLSIALGPEPTQAMDRPQGGPPREQHQQAGHGFDGQGRERQAHGRAAHPDGRTFDDETEPAAPRRDAKPGVFL